MSLFNIMACTMALLKANRCQCISCYSFKVNLFHVEKYLIPMLTHLPGLPIGSSTAGLCSEVTLAIALV